MELMVIPWASDVCTRRPWAWVRGVYSCIGQATQVPIGMPDVWLPFLVRGRVQSSPTKSLPF